MNGDLVSRKAVLKEIDCACEVWHIGHDGRLYKGCNPKRNQDTYVRLRSVKRAIHMVKPAVQGEGQTGTDGGIGTLKPCPFCGGEAVILNEAECDVWHVMCGNEDCEVRPWTDFYDSQEEAIEVWNRRGVRE